MASFVGANNVASSNRFRVGTSRARCKRRKRRLKTGSSPRRSVRFILLLFTKCSWIELESARSGSNKCTIMGGVIEHRGSHVLYREAPQRHSTLRIQAQDPALY